VSFFIALILILPGAVRLAASPNFVSITVEERAGVQRIDEYACFGIPLPRDWNVTDVSTLRLSDSGGAPIPAQFEALARWGGHADDGAAPVKWVLVGCFQSVSANGSRTLRLDREGPGPSPDASVGIDESVPGKLTVDTGAARFEINTGADFNILNQATIDGQSLLLPLSARGAIAYSSVGSVTVIPGGTPDYTPRGASVTVERSGSLNAVVKVMGSIIHGASKPVLDFTARLHFYAGRPDVRLDFTVENNHPVVAGAWGQPTNAHNQGAANSVYIGGLKLSLQLKNSGSDFRVLTEEGGDAVEPSHRVKLYQDSSGTDYWDAYVGQVGWEGAEASAAPRLQSYCTGQGFEITGPFATKTGRQSRGWMSAFFSSGPGVTAAVKDFWQNFPKAMETSTDAILTVDLFPEGSRFYHNVRVGEEKTHTIFYHFGTNDVTADEAARLAAAFNTPLFGVAPASWRRSSGAMGEAPVENLFRWPLYERYVRVAFEPNPAVGPDGGDQ
ncbi:MAG: hypothetical protein GY859_14825, partial [Desulfobacterales bacterium]|nr:hypothetical protein [Desulfobacterales bacterium]